jgi:hypothetical protein
MLLLTLKAEWFTVETTKLLLLLVRRLGRTLMRPGLAFVIEKLARGWIDLVYCYAESVLVRRSARTQPQSEIVQAPIFNPTSSPFVPGQSIV